MRWGILRTRRSGIAEVRGVKPGAHGVRKLEPGRDCSTLSTDSPIRPFSHSPIQPRPRHPMVSFITRWRALGLIGLVTKSFAPARMASMASTRWPCETETITLTV